MRFLVAQPGASFAVADVHNGWVEALRECGQQVFEFNLDDRLVFYSNARLPEPPCPTCGHTEDRTALDAEQANELAINGLYASILKVRPHVLLSVSSFFVPPHLLVTARAAGVRVVLAHTECPYENQRQAAIAQYADLNLVDDPTGIDAFPTGTTHYFPKAYRPSIHHPGPPDPALVCDLAFVGTAFPSRVAFLEAMDLGGLDVALAGNWAPLPEGSPLRRHVAHDISQGLDNEDAAALYRSARVGINLYRREAQAEHLSRGYSMGPRELEMAACQLPFARDPRPEGDELFPMLPTFSSPEEASKLIRWWLAHPDEASEAGAQAAAAIAERTFTNHAKRLLRLLSS